MLADSRLVALDSVALESAVADLAAALDDDTEGRFPGPDRRDVADLLRWLVDGHFVLLGYQRCPVRDGRATVDPDSRLGTMLRRTEVLPPFMVKLLVPVSASPDMLWYSMTLCIFSPLAANRFHLIFRRCIGLFRRWPRKAS